MAIDGSLATEHDIVLAKDVRRQALLHPRVHEVNVDLPDTTVTKVAHVQHRDPGLGVVGSAELGAERSGADVGLMVLDQLADRKAAPLGHTVAPGSYAVTTFVRARATCRC